MNITDDERFAIKLLAHPTFTVDFVERFQIGVGNSCKPTVLQAELNGFMAAVRALSKPDAQHAICRKINMDNKIEDIRLRMEECFSEEHNTTPEILKLRDNDDFLQYAYMRWDKMLSWIDVGDVYWETCDDAIREALEMRHILLADAG